jgi:hypothetical protein
MLHIIIKIINGQGVAAVNREAALGVLQAEIPVANKLIRDQMRMEINLIFL